VRTFSLALMTVLAVGGVAEAQWWGGGYHSSTVEEGVQRGFADVVRSAGAANLMNSMASKNLEDARQKYIENRLQSTETFFEMRRINQEARNANRPRPLSMEQYVRLARMQAPDRLSVSQLDPLTGQVEWPSVLLIDAFKEDRETIERLFRERASGANTFPEIDDACQALVAKIRMNTSLFPQPNDFIRARNFAESLVHELRVGEG
jgi:hypothetical protein